jgi:hypothetical protein
MVTKVEKYVVSGKVVRKGMHFPAKGNKPEVSIYNVEMLVAGDSLNDQIQYEKQVWDIIEKTSVALPVEGSMVTISGVPLMRSSFSKKNNRWYYSLALRV